MKTAAFRKACVWLRILTLLAGPLSSAETNTTPPVLKVEVKAPVSWNLLPTDRFPECFAASLSDALTRQGLSLPVTELRSIENPAKVPYLLRVEITEWRIADAGDIACTFSARLKTPAGERRLGEYSATRWAPGVLSASSKRAYYPRELDGLQTLTRDLEKSGLLPRSAPPEFVSGSQ